MENSIFPLFYNLYGIFSDMEKGMEIQSFYILKKKYKRMWKTLL